MLGGLGGNFGQVVVVETQEIVEGSWLCGGVWRDGGRCIGERLIWFDGLWRVGIGARGGNSARLL